jgi:hypothetical protein
LFVPMTPLGPRLIQPVAYSPRTTSPPGALNTRPFSFGTTPRLASNGTPASATPL